jgi:YbbR domain-containing protein
VTSVLVAPPTVTIQGTVPGLGDANSVNTRPIDITGTTSTLTRVVGLDLPPGISSTNILTVTVSIYIAPLQGKVTTDAPVTLKNLPPNLTATVSPASVTVTLRGPLPKLNTVEIHPVVDVGGLPAGSYVLPVQVAAPSDIGVQITPADVTVTLAPTPTPTRDLGGKGSALTELAKGVILVRGCSSCIEVSLPSSAWAGRRRLSVDEVEAYRTG